VAPAIVKAVSSGAAPVSVLRILGALSKHGPTGKIGKRTTRTTVDEARAQLEAGFALAAQWPDKFFELLDGLRIPASSGGGAQLLREALPGLGDFASLLSDAFWREQVARAIDSYCVRTLASEIPIVGRNAVLSSGPMTMKQVADRLGLGIVKVARTIDSQCSTIRGTRVTANGRRRRVVSEEDLAHIATVLDETVAVKQAARLLALPVSRVRSLIRAGLLTAKGGFLVRSDVVALASSPEKSPSALDPPGPYLQLRLALRNWIQGDITSAFLRALNASELSAVESTRALRLGQWLVSEPEVQAWVASRRSSDTAILTMRQVATAMALKHDVLLDLVRSGLLSAVKGCHGGRQSWLISAADLAAFRDRYVPLSDLTKSVGVRPRDGLQWAQGQGLKVVCGPCIDGSRKYFVERDAMAWQRQPCAIRSRSGQPGSASDAAVV